MKKYIPFVFIICLTLAGCVKEAPLIQNSYLVVEVGPITLTSHLTGNDSIWEGAGDPLVNVKWQYVGDAIIPELYKTKSMCQKTDVYIISVKVGDEQIQHLFVQYSGGEYLVVDRPEVKAYLMQKNKGEPVN